MARVNCSYSISASAGESVTRDSCPALRAPYYSSSSDSSRSTMDLKITSVQYETTNQTYYIGWECKMYTPGSGRYSCAAVGAAMGGEYTGSQSGSGPVYLGEHVIMSKTPSGTYIWTYTDYSSSTVPGSGTYTTTGTSVYLDCRHMMSGGYSSDDNHTRWWNGTNGYRKIGYGYLNITAPTIGNPTITSSLSASASSSRGGATGTATISASASAGTNGGDVSYTITCNGKTSTNGALSLTGLKNNTNYAWTATATNSAGKTATSTGTICLTPQVPATPTVSTTPSRTGCTFSVSSSYDTNRAYSSTSIKYGTSTSYGSTSASTTLSNLTPNTTYYYSVTVTDKNSGGGYTSARTSAAKTGSFTTTGNAPSISSITPEVYRTKAILNYSATYDTNDSFSSLSIKYGTSTSYGSTSTSTTLSNLQPNKTYYYSMTVTSSKSRTSSAKTGSFKTTAYMPSGLSITISNILPFTASAKVTGSGDTNAAITNYTYYYRTKPTKAIYDMPIKTLSDGSSWARIFYHNNKAGTVLFSSLAECKNTQTTDKYSRMYLLDDNTYKGSDGKFEFMLCYPIDAPGQYNRWKQTNAPQKEYVTRVSSGSKVTGYEAIHIDWTTNYWGGLERYQSDTSTVNTTWLDGSVGHGNWFYAIGALVTHGKGIPSYSSTADVVELWVRIDDATTTTISMGTSTSANITGLSEETDYIFYMSATNAAGTNYSSAVNVTTLADQAKIRRRVDGQWVKGKTYFKKDGVWVKAKKIYIKVDGVWKIGSNYDN